MHKLAACLIMVALVVLAAAVPACSSSGYTQERSQQIAQNAVVHEPTYVFDGMPETLKLVSTRTLESPDSWTFTFEYSSRHGGYGDRSGQIVTQAITPHQAVVTVQQGKITSAVLDGKWDMILQKMIS
jgi:hypothetical protein